MRVGKRGRRADDDRRGGWVGLGGDGGVASPLLLWSQGQLGTM